MSRRCELLPIDDGFNWVRENLNRIEGIYDEIQALKTQRAILQGRLLGISEEKIIMICDTPEVETKK